jgi:hypothetical protein
MVEVVGLQNAKAAMHNGRRGRCALHLTIRQTN